MLRLGLILLLLATPTLAQMAGPLRPDPALTPRGPAAAEGALVWLHPHYTEGPPPAAPLWTARLTEAGWDLWRLDRRPGADPLLPGAEALAAGTAALRAQGYRRILVTGESRGSFIALVALRHPGLADGMLIAAPAAHGTRPERRPQALADYAAALEAAVPSAAPRLALALFRDDAWDPDPEARAALFRSAVTRLGATGLLIDRPAAPQGHGGVQDPAFDARFGDCVVRFLTGAAPGCDAP